MEKIKKNYPTLDIAKFIMAILVVAIHVNPFSGVLSFICNQYVTRVADPLFFTITAFLMFKKAFENDLSWHSLQKYMLRIVKLYTCWVLIYSPIIVANTINEANDSAQFIWILLQKILFKGPYGALWFLTALLFAIPLTFIVTKYCSPYFCLAVSFPFFLLTVAQMEYTVLWANVTWFQIIIQRVESVFGWMANGLTFGFFFCSLGMIVAYQLHQSKRGFGAIKINAACFVISCIATFIEACIIKIYHLGYDFAAMFFLIPVTYFAMLLLLQLEIKERLIYRYLRKSSILIFTVHYGVLEILQRTIAAQWSTTVLFIVVVLITLLISVVIIRLSELKAFKWLRILY